DSDLVYLYNAASLLVLPSLQEGFGLPAMEALACGAPVAASSTGSLPEILGESAQYFDPQNQDEMCRIIRKILADQNLAQKMKENGLQRAAQYSWTKASQQALSIFREMTGR
ncbi:MAG: glycosyltransferase family 1 protein, partial [Acidobacteria bacterium]